MEDLQSLMTCLDEISGQISDGMYLKMTDKFKRVYDKLSGDKPFHEDQFYYSDDDSELGSDDDSDYGPPRPAVRAPFAPNIDRVRLAEIARLRDQLLGYVKKMHEEYKVLTRWEKEANRTDWTPIKRMTAFRKSQAIKLWCEKNICWATGDEAGELVGHISTAAAYHSWTWKNLLENGLRTIVLEIGTEGEIRNSALLPWAQFVYYDELSLKTLQKLPAFEKKIYDDYKEECQRKMTEYFDTAKLKVADEKERMTNWEVLCIELEEKLIMLGAPIYCRDYWNPTRKEFWVDDNGRMVDTSTLRRVD